MAPPENFAILLTQIQYPGATTDESEVIRFWLGQFGNTYDRIEFNVRVGAGSNLPIDLDDPFRAGARALSQKRIDVVAFTGDQVRLLEAKIRCGLGGAGQLIGYAQLWAKDHPETQHVTLEVACRFLDQDVADVLAANGIGVTVFPYPDRPAVRA